MAEYIEREALNDFFDREIRLYEPCPDKYDAAVELKGASLSIPAADVRRAQEVSDATDEALRILDAIHSSGKLDYGDYCDLHDAISAIYGTEAKEGADNGSEK